MKVKCFLDIDDVLADTTLAVIKYWGYYDNEIKFGMRDIHEQMGKSHEKIWGELSADFWTTLPKTPWADPLVELAYEKFGRENVFLLTAPIKNPGCYAGKFNWVEKYYPDLLNSFAIAKRKQHFVDEHSLLIDDSYHNEEHFVKNNKSDNFYLFPAVTNRLHEKALIYYNSTSLCIKDTSRAVESFLNAKIQQG